MVRISSILFLLLLASCYTSKKATWQVAKADVTFPTIVKEYCGDHYPPVISGGRVDTAYFRDTAHTSEIIEVAGAGTTDTIIRTKTIREQVTITRIDTVENKAKALALQSRLDDLNIEFRDVDKDAKKWKTRTWALAGVLALIAALAGVRAFIAAKGWS